jgi:hypothetical protein
MDERGGDECDEESHSADPLREPGHRPGFDSLRRFVRVWDGSADQILEFVAGNGPGSGLMPDCRHIFNRRNAAPVLELGDFS